MILKGIAFFAIPLNYNRFDENNERKKGEDYFYRYSSIDFCCKICYNQ